MAELEDGEPRQRVGNPAAGRRCGQARGTQRTARARSAWPAQTRTRSGSSAVPARAASAARAAGAGDAGTPRLAGGDAVDRAGDRDEPRAHRDLEAAQAARVTAAVEALVRGAHQRRRLAEAGHRREQLEDHVGMAQRQHAIEAGQRLGRLAQRLRQQRQAELVQRRRLGHRRGRRPSSMPMARRQLQRDGARARGVAGRAGQPAIEERGEGRRQAGFRARLALAGVAHQRRLRDHRALELAIAGAILGRRVAPLEGAVHRAASPSRASAAPRSPPPRRGGRGTRAPSRRSGARR